MQRRLPADTALVEYVVADEARVRLRHPLDRHPGEDRSDPVGRSGGQGGAAPRPDRARSRHATGRRRRRASTRRSSRPIEQAGWLAGVHHLYLVPHGILHYVPFAALPRGREKGARLVVNDYVVAYLPAAAALADGNGSAGSTAARRRRSPSWRWRRHGPASSSRSRRPRPSRASSRRTGSCSSAAARPRPRSRRRPAASTFCTWRRTGTSTVQPAAVGPRAGAGREGGRAPRGARDSRLEARRAAWWCSAPATRRSAAATSPKSPPATTSSASRGRSCSRAARRSSRASGRSTTVRRWG